MTDDFFINTLQLNTGNINVNITSTDYDMPFGNAKYNVPNNTKGVIFPIYKENDKFDINFTIWGRGDVWDDLMAKEKLIYDELLKQVSDRIPTRFRTTDTEIYLSYKDIFVVVDDVKFSHDGKNGTHLLDIKMSGRVLGISTDDGGTIDPLDPWA